jgi:hypothetical protein
MQCTVYYLDDTMTWFYRLSLHLHRSMLVHPEERAAGRAVLL